jgi:protein gp37
MSHRNLNENEVHWKLTTGCTVIGPGCDSCPAMGGDSSHKTKIFPERLSIPASIKEPKIFYLSLGSDFFQDNVTEEFILNAFRIMIFNPMHKFVILTKRADRLRHLAPKLKLTDNMYIGVTVASKSCKHRMEALRTVKSKNRFISMAPLLEDLGELNLEGIKSVGVVEETWGPKRKIQQAWVDNIEKQCQEQDVLFNFDDAILWNK